MQNDSYPLTFAFLASWVASLTGLCALLCIVMLWAGAMTLSLGVEQKEKRIARQAVGGLWALACLTALVAPLTLSRGVLSIISETKEGSKDFAPKLTAVGKSWLYRQCSFTSWVTINSLLITFITSYINKSADSQFSYL